MTNHELLDTVLIGLGPAGREVLSQIAGALSTRYGSCWPANVRMLQVDVLPEADKVHLSPPPGLQAEQWTLLRPDLQGVEHSLREHPEHWPHWQWYLGTAPDYGRARGRMALFHDLKDGSLNSALWKALERALDGLSLPAVRVIGTTFDDVASGMLIDMARLVQIVAHRDLKVQLWLAGPMKRDWSERLSGRRQKVRVDEQVSRTLATLRELQRFQRNAPVSYTYVSSQNLQDQLRSTYNYSVIESIYLFEQQNPEVSPENDVLACMADCLLALLHPAAHDALSQLLKGKIRQIGERANQKGQGAVLALGAYSVRKPTALLIPAIAWRMVRDVLFETAMGIMPLEELILSTGDYRKLDELDQGQPDRSIHLPTRDEIETLVFRYRQHLDSRAFVEEVRKRVNALLNGEQEGFEPLIMRRAGLAQAIKWSKMLSGILAAENASGPARRVNELIRQLEAWQVWLKETVYPLCVGRWQDARQELERLRTQPVRSWGLDETLEWSTYRQTIRPWNDRPIGNAQNEPLLRLAGRFGWDVECLEGGGWRPTFIIPPGEFVWQGHIEDLNPYRLTSPTDERQALQELYHIASCLAHVGQTSIWQLARSQDATRWIQSSNVHLGYDGELATSLVGKVDELTILIAPASAEHVAQLEERFKSMSGFKGQLAVCQVDDDTAITVLRAVDWIPLSAVNMYSDETWRNTVVPPSLYVWRAEQLAAEIEEDEQMSALFVSRLEEDESLLRAFGLSVIYGIITKTENGWSIPNLGEVPATSLADLVDRVFDAGDRAPLTAALQKELESRRQQITERFLYLRKIENEIVQPLLQSPDGKEHDLGCYLRGLIRAERGG